MVTAEGVWPKEGNDPLYASEVNLFQNRFRQVYIGSGFDSTRASTGTTTGSAEMNFIGSTALLGATYGKISILGTASCSIGANAGGNVNLKIASREVSGTYVNLFDFKTILGNSANDTTTTTGNFDYLHTLSTAEKTSGVQFMIFTNSVIDADGGTASYTNIQTTIGVY